MSPEATSALAAELRAAIPAGGVGVAFQPIIRQPGRAVVSVEALARWQRASGETVPPSTFVPLAEEQGVILDLDLAVLERALVAVAEWRAGSRPDLRISVNFSASSLADPDSVGEILTRIDAAGVPRDAVTVEVTESILVDDEAVHSCRRLGHEDVRIALDDLGTGFSSLSYLLRLPVDAIKIDREFCSRVCDSAVAATVVRSLVGIGRELEISVVAEGVETDDVDARLRELGVRLLQGYLYGRPAPDLPAAEERPGRRLRPVAAPLPADEPERLAALRRLDVVGSSREEQFDQLAAMAADVCETPFAVVSLVDADRQWAKAVVGTDLTAAPREIAFCAHAILATDLFVVEDTWADDRFAANPLVIGSPGIRFYAGAPLITAGGAAIGTLCVADHHPRTLDPRQRRLLTGLATQVVSSLELRAAVTGRPVTRAVHAMPQVRSAHRYETPIEDMSGRPQVASWRAGATR